jgi:periplasmic protein TonB
MNTSNSAPFRDALDIVFANRNREYGAYQLRRAYPRYLLRALTIGIVLIGIGVLLPHIVSAVSAMIPEAPPVEVTVELGPPREIDATPPPPPPPPVPTPPPPPRSTQIFVPPAVLRDDLVEERERPSVEDLKNNNKDIGTQNIDVTEERPPVIDPGLDDIPVIEEPEKPKEEEVFDIFGINKPPTFPGGEKELLRFLAENIQYPALARESNVQGNVALSFVIGKDGTVTDVQVLKDIGAGCGKEAVRVVRNMPKWFPGEANGNPVKVRYTLPVKFRLD